MSKKEPVKAVKLPKEGTKAHKELKWKESIELLNDIVRLKLAPSDIDGIGVFALRDIPKGTKLELDAIPHAFDLPYSKFRKLTPEAREEILKSFPTVVKGSHFIYPVTRFLAFLNHSDKPNYDTKTDKVLRNIKKGDEITEDYRKIEGWEKIYKWLKK